MFDYKRLEAVSVAGEAPATEPERQYYFMKKCKQWATGEISRLGRPLTMSVQTLGCQMNAKDSEKMTAILEYIGYTEIDGPIADFVMYNTCTVRENANLKIYGRLGYLKNHKKSNPRMKIALCGCMMQEADEVQRIQKSYPFVDLVFGTHNIYKLAELLYTQIQSDRRVTDVWEEPQEIVEDLPGKRKYPFKTGVNIMFGCNNFCSYCIVPYVRGREVSRPSTEILNEIKSLIDKGAKEVCLLGQNVNSYGKNLSEDINFPKLLSMVNKIDGLERIRFVTSHPKDFSINMINAMAENEKVYRYLHLPLQSGSNIILKAMNRKYTYEDYKEKIELARKIMPDIEFSSDFIIGFPNETDEDFNATLKAVEEIGYDRIFAFNYSPRPGTKAFDIEDNVPANVKSERLNTLFTFQDSLYDKKLTEMKGITTQVLVTDIDETKEYSYYGLNIYNRKVAFSSKNKLEYGSIVNVLIDTAKRNCMYGIEV